MPRDRETLRQIAEQTGGKYFSAPSAEALNAAYSELDSLLSREPGKDEATYAFVLAAASSASARPSCRRSGSAGFPDGEQVEQPLEAM